MNPKSPIAVAVCLAVLEAACSSSPQNLILGKWEIDLQVVRPALFVLIAAED